jgi:hypothetical protein
MTNYTMITLTQIIKLDVHSDIACLISNWLFKTIFDSHGAHSARFSAHFNKELPEHKKAL